jgi:hypothetical protein
MAEHAHNRAPREYEDGDATCAIDEAPHTLIIPRRFYPITSTPLRFRPPRRRGTLEVCMNLAAESVRCAAHRLGKPR